MGQRVIESVTESAAHSEPEQLELEEWQLELEEFEFAGCMMNSNSGAPNGTFPY